MCPLSTKDYTNKDYKSIRIKEEPPALDLEGNWNRTINHLDMKVEQIKHEDENMEFVQYLS